MCQVSRWLQLAQRHTAAKRLAGTGRREGTTAQPGPLPPLLGAESERDPTCSGPEPGPTPRMLSWARSFGTCRRNVFRLPREYICTRSKGKGNKKCLLYKPEREHTRQAHFLDCQPAQPGSWAGSLGLPAGQTELGGNALPGLSSECGPGRS